MKFKTMTLLALLAANSFFLPGAMLHGADTPAEKAEFARYMEQAEKAEFARYMELAKKGDATAMFNLGNCYKNGEGVEKNYEEAVKWYKKAAEKGNATAMCNLGNCYYNGNGVEKNDEEAVKWYKKAAEEGNARAMNNLGNCYENGEGVEKNDEEAVKWFTRAAELGHIGAVKNLARCYRDGDGVEEDDAKAFELYQQILASDEATEKQKEDAHEEIAKAYFFGNGTEWSIPLAHWHFKQAGHPHWYYWMLIPAVVVLGFILLFKVLIPALGQLIKKIIIQRKVKKAEAGNAEAMYELGVCYANGNGVEKDETEAIKWLEKAAELGYTNANAATVLGLCYYNKKNYSEAIKWLEKAVELDNTNANAATVLGLCCYNEKNYTEAIKWLEKAVELGNTDANAATVLRDCYDHSNQKDEAEKE